MLEPLYLREPAVPIFKLLSTVSDITFDGFQSLDHAILPVQQANQFHEILIPLLIHPGEMNHIDARSPP